MAISIDEIQHNTAYLLSHAKIGIDRMQILLNRMDAYGKRPVRGHWVIIPTAEDLPDVLFIPGN